MERDFLGLNSRGSAVVVKEEAVEECKDSGLGFQWTSSNKVSTLPHFMSVGKTTKVMSDPLASSGFMALSAADGCTNIHSRPSGEMENFAGTTMKQQLLGGTPVTAPHPLPFVSVAGISGSWFNSKSFGAPPQLTIFYGGMVNVYSDISHEKAQAIMFLAGNGCSTAFDVAKPRAEVQIPAFKQTGGEGVLVNQPANTSPSSCLSSSMSVSSDPVGQSGYSGSGSGTNNEVMAVKPTGFSITTTLTKFDPPKKDMSLGPVGATATIPSAVPQARKASLARFLEKRKERVMNSAPYNTGKNSHECVTPGANGATFSPSTGSLSTNKESSHDV